jgi:secreted trypsin-like serine protease
MRLAPSLLFVATSAVVACFDTPREEQRASTHSHIVGGTPSTSAQDATVMLTENGEFACTATLIAPNLILTARHCVATLDEESDCGIVQKDHDVSGFGVEPGVDATGSDAVASGKRLIVPSSNDLCGSDVALIELDRDVPDAMVAKVRFSPLKVGETTVAVGYGDDGSGKQTEGRFQRTGVEITGVGPASSSYKTQDGKSLPVPLTDGDVLSTESTCFGDSGGPLFDSKGRLVGVTSRGIDDACIDRPTIWTGLPRHEKFIRDAAKSAGHPLPEDPKTDPKPKKPKPNGSQDGGDDDDDGAAKTPATEKDTSSKSKTTTPSGDDDDDDSTDKESPTKHQTVAAPAAPGLACSARPGKGSDPCGLTLLGLALVARSRRRRVSHRPFGLSAGLRPDLVSS